MPNYQVDQQGAVTYLRLDKPPVNTLDVPLMRELAATVRDLASGELRAGSGAIAALKSRSRALVLTSSVAGQFCLGIDPAAVLGTDVYGRKAIFLALAELVEALWFSCIPLIVDVSGPALAGGAVLAVLGDFAVMDRNAGKICFSEPKVGLPLPYFVQRLIQRKINPASVNEVVLLGRNIDAVEAERIGFANMTYGDSGERDEVLSALIGKIVRLPPAVLSETLRQSRVAERQLLDGFRQDLASFADFLGDDYLVKGLTAMIKGEAPKF